MVPLFNEGEVVGEVIRDLRTRYPLVVCVDDGSEDDSADRRRPAPCGAPPYNMGQGAR